MMKLIPLLLLGVGNQVVPCGSALCIGGNQQPVTLGNTIQVNQGFWPDGGLASLTPVVPGASLDIRGSQHELLPDAGPNLVPDVLLRSTNSRQASAPIVSIQRNALEVVRFGVNSSGTVPCDGGTPAIAVTVPSGSHCVCGLKASGYCPVSSTTLTVTCASGDIVQAPYLCF